MKRVYRLLRNNNEYGPYTIDELLGQQLRSTDMLWVEGESTAWCYLSEIVLKPTLKQENSSKGPLKIKARTSFDSIEKKAEEIRKQVLAFKPQAMPVMEEIVSNEEVHYYIPTPAGDDTIELVDHRKQKSTMINDLLMTGVIVTLFAGGLYGGQALFSPKSHQPVSPATVVSNDQHAAKVFNEPAFQETSILTPVVDSTTSSDTLSSALLPRTKTFVRKADSSRIAVRPDTSLIIPSELNSALTNQVEAEQKDGEEIKIKKQPEEIIKKTEEPKAVINKEPVKKEKDTIKKEEPEKKGFLKKLFGKKKKDGND